MAKHRYYPLFLIALTALIGSSNGIAVKIGIRDIAPISFLTLRMVVALLIALPLIIKVKIWNIDHKLQLAFVSSLITINMILFVIGIEKTNVSIASVLYTATPLVTAILSHFIYQEKISVKKALGIFLGLFGASIVILAPALSKNALQAGNIAGNIIISIAVISFALYMTFSKKVQKHHSPLTITYGNIIISTLIVVPLAIFLNGQTNQLHVINFSTSAIISLVYIAVIGTVFFSFLHQYNIKRSSPLTASLFTYLQPIFAIILAVIILKESLSSVFIFGSLLTFLGVWLAGGNSTKKPQKMVKYG